MDNHKLITISIFEKKKFNMKKDSIFVFFFCFYEKYAWKNFRIWPYATKYFFLFENVLKYFFYFFLKYFGENQVF